MTYLKFSELQQLELLATDAEREWTSKEPTPTLRQFHETFNPSMILRLIKSIEETRPTFSPHEAIKALRESCDEIEPTDGKGGYSITGVFDLPLLLARLGVEVTPDHEDTEES